MQYILTGEEMQECDANTTEHYRVPSIVLMEQAALAVVEELKRQKLPMENVLILCGSGNNGGDGLAVARLLALDKKKVTAVFAGNREHATEQNRLQCEILEAYGIPLVETIPEDTYTLIIDAIFGVGLSRPVTGSCAELLEKVNQMDGIKVALDIASGVHATTGHADGACFCADLTLTFAFYKRGQLLYPGSRYSGRVIRLPIGIDMHGFLGKTPQMRSLEKEDFGLLPDRKPYSNKGTYGKLLLFAGSMGMAGAAVLAARAAYAAGCGLVRIVTPEENRLIVQTAVPEAVLTLYEAGKTENLPWEELFAWADGIVAGPGLGTDVAAVTLVERVLAQKKLPVVLDADGLNILAVHRELFENLSGRVILTPHLGEMARLTQGTVGAIQKNLAGTAAHFAEKYQVICVQKDARTITALPDGTLFLNCSGNDGMATAGSGDVLSGITGSLLVQGMPPELAAPYGAYLHGLAGDLMAEETGRAGLMASDLVTGVKLIRKEIEKNRELCL